MSTVTRRRATIRHKPREPIVEGLKVSPFENVASLILALLILVGATVLVLFVIWLGNKIFSAPQSVPVILEDVGGGRPEGVVGESMELDAPDAEEIAKESELTVPQFQETLAKVSAIISARMNELDDPELVEQVESGGGGKLQGDGRQVGYGFGDGPPGVPRFKRWEIYYAEGGSLEEYARQLDFFRIELGVVDGDQVIYVTNLSSSTPTKRTAPADQEKRLYMSWRQGNLKAADQKLLAQAGAAAQDRLAVQFYPTDIENRLAQLEVSFANRKPEQIRRTRFAVRAAGDGFEYYVMDQTPL